MDASIFDKVGKGECTPISPATHSAVAAGVVYIQASRALTATEKLECGAAATTTPPPLSAASGAGRFSVNLCIYASISAVLMART